MVAQVQAGAGPDGQGGWGGGVKHSFLPGRAPGPPPRSPFSRRLSDNGVSHYKVEFGVFGTYGVVGGGKGEGRGENFLCRRCSGETARFGGGICVGVKWKGRPVLEMKGGRGLSSLTLL